jgi:hypothetical protein
MLFTDKKDWYTARDTCQQLAGVFGGNLTELFVRKDMDFLATWMNSKGVNSAWIGLTTNAKGHWDDRMWWYWAKHGENLKTTFDAWAPGFPHKKQGACGLLVANSKAWQNNPCASKAAFVCDIPF